ncbi:MAG: protein-L-isoaspartate O-methyltransferase [Nanoarchaeota archaeon]|nr:protein-L-isoaspartate O-methyltransferase [Nanoarchaeota archaeon]
MNKTQLLESLRKKGFSKKIISAFEKVKRENFIPRQLNSRAYEDTALPIGHGQTISQPYTIAVMLSLLNLEKGQKVLEIGSGSGYVLALLSEILGKNGEVFGIELIKELAEKSINSLEQYKNIRVYIKNGASGLKEQAPFDRILISAGGESVPEKVLWQLKDKGILVAPVGPRYEQSLIVIQRNKEKFITKKQIPGFVFVRFVED